MNAARIQPESSDWIDDTYWVVVISDRIVDVTG
jgi:hypothetical protein